MLNTKDVITNWYSKILLREPDSEGLKYFTHLLDTKSISENEFVSILKNSEEFKIVEKNKNDFNINFFEKKHFSQHGEDGILDFIFRRIGTTNQFLVEIGLEDGSECNSRYFLENGWNGILLDNFSYSTNISWSDPVSKSKRLEFKQKNFSIPKKISTFLQNEFVTMENINKIFHK